MSETMTLQEAADRLGVHYMTAYRYVRLGKLPATKVGATWVVALQDLEPLVANGQTHTPRHSKEWDKQLESGAPRR